MSLYAKSRKAIEDGGFSLFLFRSKNYIYNKIVPNVIDTFIDERGIALPHESGWKIISLPSFNDRLIPVLSEKVGGTRHCSQKHQELMISTYTLEGFVEIEESDIIMDIGAYLGGFSIPASKMAKEVISIDPNSKISPCLEHNVSKYENISVLSIAAWKEKDKLTINQSIYPNDNSILSPDENSINKEFEVEADTVANIAKDRNLERIDFLKVEAEGVEPEILEGAMDDSVEISKIAVNCGPERNGKPTVEETVEILERNGYDTKQDSNSEVGWSKWIVFGAK